MTRNHIGGTARVALAVATLVAGCAAARADANRTTEEVREAFARDARHGVALQAPDTMRALSVRKVDGRTVLVPCVLRAGSMVEVAGREAGHGVLVGVTEVASHGDGGARACPARALAFLEPDANDVPLAKWVAPEEVWAAQAADAVARQDAMDARSREVDAVVARITASMPGHAPKDGTVR